MMEQSETKRHVYPTSCRVEAQVAGAPLSQSYKKHCITRIQISRTRQKSSLQRVPQTKHCSLGFDYCCGLC